MWMAEVMMMNRADHRWRTLSDSYAKPVRRERTLFLPARPMTRGRFAYVNLAA